MKLQSDGSVTTVEKLYNCQHAGQQFLTQDWCGNQLIPYHFIVVKGLSCFVSAVTENEYDLKIDILEVSETISIQVSIIAVSL